MRQYRIVEHRPGQFAIQWKSKWFGWLYVYSDLWDIRITTKTPEEAEALVLEWKAGDAHKLRVVKVL